VASPSIITTEAALLRLLQLSSPALPVGAYAFSQGLEAAMDLQWLRTQQHVGEWLQLQLQQGLALVDLPAILHLHAAFGAQDYPQVHYLNALLLACRETEELRLGDIATGAALARLLPTLSLPLPLTLEPPLFTTLFTFAAVQWQISAELTALGYVWTWLENQVIAATKLLPLGQTQAQQLLSSLQQQIPAAIAIAHTVDADSIGSSLPGLAFASMHHETQYTRLFRS
jgi:urease accessory protein